LSDGVEDANTKLSTSFWRTSRTIPTWPSKNLFHNSLFRMKRGSTTSILSQNNKACSGTNELVKIVISLHYVTAFLFHVVCKQPTTAKMHKIFIAQKSYMCCSELCYCKKQTLFLILFGRELGQAENFLIAPRKHQQ